MDIFDMTAYQDYFDNKLADDVFEEENVNKALANLPNVEQLEILYVVFFNYLEVIEKVIIRVVFAENVIHSWRK